MATIAMFLARSLRPPMTGRKAVLNTALEALAREGHEVDLFILARREPAPVWARRTVWLGPVPKAGMLCHAALAVLGGERSLNEALFRSRRALAFARSLRGAYDFAIADTIRTAPYASELGVPWHLDLDDLFSSRYEKYLEQQGDLSPGLILGYYRASVPGVAALLPRSLIRRLLRTEAARLRRREVYWARRACTVSLVSPQEAAGFARAAARPVHSLPMSVAIPAQHWTAGEPAAGAAFLGGLDYKPNLDALVYYQENVFPALKAAGGIALPLSHIGQAPAELRRRFRPDAVRFEGYVEDAVSRLGAAAFFLAPIVGGTGIKTKVLEAMAVGLPVLATPHAVAGLQVEHKNQCFICERPAAFAEGMRYLRDGRAAARMGMSGRDYVQANFSMDVLRARWRRVVGELALGAAGRGSGAFQA